MTAESILAEFAQRGVTLTVRGGEIIARPLSAVPDELRKLVQQHKAEILAAISPSCRAQPSGAGESFSLSALLANIADAIASAPRSPFLDDLAIARTARVLVEAERTIRDASPSISIEAAGVAGEAMNRVAGAIRATRYATAYDLLDTLSSRMCRMRPH